MPQAYQPSKVLGFWSAAVLMCLVANKDTPWINLIEERSKQKVLKCVTLLRNVGLLEPVRNWIFFSLNHLVNLYRRQIFWLTLNLLWHLWLSLMRSNRYSHYISLQLAFGQSEQSSNHLLMPPSPQETGHWSSVWCCLSVVLFSSQPC